MKTNRRKFIASVSLLGLGGTAAYILGGKTNLFKAAGIISNSDTLSLPSPAPTPPDYELLIPTYLGNDQRRYYGRGIPEKLGVINKFNLGCGKTAIGTGFAAWCGAGWTGQPTIVKDKEETFLVIGAYDHSLRKISISDFKESWRYLYDDVIKGSSTVYIDETADDENKIVVLQGSRKGNQNRVYSDNIVPSFRAVSFRTGKELWKLNISRTKSYSRDNDSSAIYLGNGLLFNAGENAVGYFLSSSVKDAEEREGLLQPKIIAEIQLYDDSDVASHRGNLVAEASPARIGDKIYIACGSGHIYGIDIESKEIIWDYYVGSDIDGTSAVSIDNKLFCAIEKQYIPGKGGILKLNPSKSPEEAVDWFLPTGNRRFAGWDGGVIGSAAINDEYNDGSLPRLFATNSIEGNLYIGAQREISGVKAKDPMNKVLCNVPKIAAAKSIGPSISTPIFTEGNRLISAGYDGIYLFEIEYEKIEIETSETIKNDYGDNFKLRLNLIDKFLPGGSFESTPVVWNGIVYICSRDGNLYALS